MPPRGRPPLPTNIRILEGNRAHAPIKRTVTAPVPADMPTPPDFLHRYAVEEWRRLAPALYAMGILAEVDRGALAACCQAYAFWRECTEKLNEMAKADPVTGGLLAKTKGGNIIENPIYSAAKTAMRDYMRFMTEFGMSPSARARIEAKSGDKETDPIARKYFGS